MVLDFGVARGLAIPMATSEIAIVIVGRTPEQRRAQLLHYRVEKVDWLAGVYVRAKKGEAYCATFGRGLRVRRAFGQLGYFGNYRRGQGGENEIKRVKGGDRSTPKKRIKISKRELNEKEEDKNRFQTPPAKKKREQEEGAKERWNKSAFQPAKAHSKDGWDMDG